MKRILIYKEEGVDPFSLGSLIFSLKLENQTHIAYADRQLLRTSSWKKESDLLIFPGGRDLPYHEALKGEGCAHIKDFVTQGGRFLGLCAGGYFGSAYLEFEKGGELEVVGSRELGFFPGIATGPALGQGKFCYGNLEGAEMAKLERSTTTSAIFYNGGCAFAHAENYPHIAVLARFSDIQTKPAAIVKCSIGSGIAILSGVHPEYTTHYKPTKKVMPKSFYLSLKESEPFRRSTFQTLLQELD